MVYRVQTQRRLAPAIIDVVRPVLLTALFIGICVAASIVGQTSLDGASW
jgi:hypothetical protein